MSGYDVDFPVGAAAYAKSLPISAASVRIDNPTNQWLYFANVCGFIPQYTVGVVYPLGETRTASFSWTAPAGLAQPPTIAGQAASLSFDNYPAPASAGIATLGGRAQWYDRNILTVIGTYYNSLGPHALTARATYTVPTGRIARIQSCQLVTESLGGYSAANVFIETRLDAVTPGGTDVIIKDAYVLSNNSLGARDEFDAPLELYLPAAAKAVLYTGDLGAGGSSYHFATVTILEFDA